MKRIKLKLCNLRTPMVTFVKIIYRFSVKSLSWWIAILWFFDIELQGVKVKQLLRNSILVPLSKYDIYFQTSYRLNSNFIIFFDSELQGVKKKFNDWHRVFIIILLSKYSVSNIVQVEYRLMFFFPAIRTRFLVKKISRLTEKFNKSNVVINTNIYHFYGRVRCHYWNLKQPTKL